MKMAHSFIYQVKIQSKIFEKYQSIMLGISIIQLAFVLAIILLNEYVTVPNLPFIISMVSIFCFGPVYTDLFNSNDQEVILYTIMPWSLQKVIIAKNIAITIKSVFILSVSLLFAFLVVESSAHQYFEAVAYFISATMVCIFLGNKMSVRSIDKKKRMTFRGFIGYSFFLVLASLPYLLSEFIFENSWFSFVITIVVFLVWYFHELPELPGKVVLNSQS